MSSDLPSTGSAIFDLWLLKRSRDTRDPLTTKASRPYRSIWNAWRSFLDRQYQNELGKDTVWSTATAADVHRFLFGGISPAGTRRITTSTFTRHRYWRVLKAVYEHAENTGHIKRSPFDDFNDKDSPPLEKSRGQIFNPYDWQEILVAIPGGDSKHEVRDRAVLMLLTDVALTTSEVCKLRTIDVGTQFRSVSLRIDGGGRSSQTRVLQLGSEASTALREWIDVRRELPDPLDEPRNALFVTQKGYRLKAGGVYHLVSKTVLQALSDRTPLLSHAGAQVIRNTRLVMWLNDGVALDEVVRRAGFKDWKSFRGLREHISPSVLPELKARDGAIPD